MRFEYTYRTTAADLWQLSMYYTYGSMVGICNVIFTAALIVLTAVRWNSSSPSFRLLLILGCCLFTVIQPAAIFLKAKKQAMGIREDTKVCFDDQGIHVTVGARSSDLKWNMIKRISRKPTMIVVFSDTTHGFVLTNKVLKGQKQEFYTFVASKIKA